MTFIHPRRTTIFSNNPNPIKDNRLFIDNKKVPLVRRDIDVPCTREESRYGEHCAYISRVYVSDRLSDRRRRRFRYGSHSLRRRRRRKVYKVSTAAAVLLHCRAAGGATRDSPRAVRSFKPLPVSFQPAPLHSRKVSFPSSAHVCVVPSVRARPLSPSRNFRDGPRQKSHAPLIYSVPRKRAQTASANGRRRTGSVGP